MTVTVCPERGLLQINVIFVVKTNAYGHELRSRFETLHEVLSKKYGRGTLRDFVRDGSMWTESQEFMISLGQDERVLAWFVHPKKGNKWKLEAAGIFCHASSDLLSSFAGNSKGSIEVIYEFEGFTEYRQQKEAEDFSEF